MGDTDDEDGVDTDEECLFRAGPSRCAATWEAPRFFESGQCNCASPGGDSCSNNRVHQPQSRLAVQQPTRVRQRGRHEDKDEGAHHEACAPRTRSCQKNIGGTPPTPCVRLQTNQQYPTLCGLLTGPVRGRVSTLGVSTPGKENSPLGFPSVHTDSVPFPGWILGQGQGSEHKCTPLPQHPLALFFCWGFLFFHLEQQLVVPTGWHAAERCASSLIPLDTSPTTPEPRPGLAGAM